MEELNVILATGDKVFIVDLMGEYALIVKRLGDLGEVIEISPDSPHHINPCPNRGSVCGSTKAGRTPEPSYVLVDSQSAKTTYASEKRGIDGGKKG